jgi:mannose-6-phosphate isomerase-like protein (cupin superfamily)
MRKLTFAHLDAFFGALFAFVFLEANFFATVLNNHNRKTGNNDMNNKHMPLANSKALYQTLLVADDYGVAKTTMKSGRETLWHRHTNVYDRFTVITGVLTVEIKFGDVVNKIEVRDYYAVAPGVSHHVKNETDSDVVYITVQSGGERDIVLEGRQEVESNFARSGTSTCTRADAPRFAQRNSIGR